MTEIQNINTIVSKKEKILKIIAFVLNLLLSIWMIHLIYGMIKENHFPPVFTALIFLIIINIYTWFLYIKEKYFKSIIIILISLFIVIYLEIYTDIFYTDIRIPKNNIAPPVMPR